MYIFAKNINTTFSLTQMKRIVTFLLMLISIVAVAQQSDNYTTIKADIEIISINLPTSKEKLSQFIRQNNIEVTYQKEYRLNSSYSFQISSDKYSTLELLLPQLGHVSTLELTKSNSRSEIERIKLEVEYLTKKRDSYNELLSWFNEKSEQYLSNWKEMKDIEERIFLLQKSMIAYSNIDNLYNVEIKITDETTTPDNTRISFVNMPGGEYSYLTINNPQEGVSAAYYQGYFVKYMFTRGKSFITLGAYNSTESQKNDSTLSELFIFGFGQDFYSRYLGRGHRRYFNLYSGYTGGYVLGTGEVTKSNFFYIAPSVGLDLFKNRYVLIDTKANYFIPFSHSKELRGWSINASVNFVF